MHLVSYDLTYHTLISMCTYCMHRRAMKKEHYCNLWCCAQRSYQGHNGFMNAIVNTLSKLLGGLYVCWCKCIPMQSAVDAALCLTIPQSDSCGVCVFAHRPNKENTGEVSESGASVVKHALNPEKPFMQVHYLKVRLKAQSAESSGISGIFGLCRFFLSLFSLRATSSWSFWLIRLAKRSSWTSSKCLWENSTGSSFCLRWACPARELSVHLARMQMLLLDGICVFWPVFQSHRLSISLCQWKNWDRFETELFDT